MIKVFVFGELSQHFGQKCFCLVSLLMNPGFCDLRLCVLIPGVPTHDSAHETVGAVPRLMNAVTKVGISFDGIPTNLVSQLMDLLAYLKFDERVHQKAMCFLNLVR